jgi:hypothetical protein
VRTRSFSVAQANACVPRLQLLVERLQRAALSLRTAREDVAAEQGLAPEGLAVEALLARRPDLRRIVEGLEGALEEIQSLGVEVKDLELGLIDFPAELDGEPIYLCWQFGEDEVGYWHRRSEGFAGRRTLPGVRPRTLQ